MYIHTFVNLCFTPTSDEDLDDLDNDDLDDEDEDIEEDDFEHQESLDSEDEMELAAASKKRLVKRKQKGSFRNEDQDNSDEEDEEEQLPVPAHHRRHSTREKNCEIADDHDETTAEIKSKHNELKNDDLEDDQELLDDYDLPKELLFTNIFTGTIILSCTIQGVEESCRNSRYICHLTDFFNKNILATFCSMNSILCI